MAVCRQSTLRRWGTVSLPLQTPYWRSSSAWMCPSWCPMRKETPVASWLPLIDAWGSEVLSDTHVKLAHIWPMANADTHENLMGRAR